jgi:DNA processing protein
MDRTAALTWSWLNVLNKRRYDALNNVYKGMEAALPHVGEQMLKALGCRDETVRGALLRLEEFDADHYDAQLQERGVTLLTLEDAVYPAQLREIADPPVFLYAKGDLSILSQPCIALVGTRAMSAYGRRVTQSFVPALVQAGMVTVSGLATGIDSEVAQETIAAGGKTVAVLAHGLAAIYPKANTQLAKNIVAKGGLLLTEFPLDQSPDTYAFPARNRIIAGLSIGTVVLEAGEGSGALITAQLALEYGRDVFAVPGQIFDPQYAGCHQLLAAGHAKLAANADAVLQEYRIAASGKTAMTYAPQNEQEGVVYEALTSMPQSVGDIIEKASIDAAVANATLTLLELHGAVKNVGGGMWVRL